MPSISIIVPVYKVEAYLHRCINSILSQTLYDFELILVDDGSPDNCGNICDEYALEDNRVKVIHKSNGGLSAARNAGIEVATGDYIGFIDSDDWVEDEMYKNMYEAAIKNEADLVVCNYSRVFKDKVINNYLKLTDENIDISEIGLDEYFYRYFFRYVHGYESWNKLYKREIIISNNLRFEEKKEEIFSEDLLFNLYLLCHVHKISSLQNSFYNYLQREGSLMNSPRPNLAVQYATLLEKFHTYSNLERKDEDISDILPILYMTLIKDGITVSSTYSNDLNIMKNIISNISDKRKFMIMMRKLAFGKAVSLYCKKTGRGIKSRIGYRMFGLLCTLNLYKLATIITKL
ncbi:MAG: glycosyltransferase family 2 protein [Clostridiaceae bacterium]